LVHVQGRVGFHSLTFEPQQRLIFSVYIRPVRSENFDGRILLRALKGPERVVSQRNSVYHQAGDRHWQYITETRKEFRALIAETVEAAKERCPFAVKFVIQYDGAGPHGKHDLLEELNEKYRHHTPPVQFVQQCPQSPQLNAMDLGVWYSLAAVVQEIRYDETNVKTICERIEENVLSAWNTPHVWPAAIKLEKIFNTKARMHQDILKAQGHNVYVRHHTQPQVQLMPVAEHEQQDLQQQQQQQQQQQSSLPRINVELVEDQVPTMIRQQRTRQPPRQLASYYTS
jgi:hypothetical protein